MTSIDNFVSLATERFEENLYLLYPIFHFYFRVSTKDHLKAKALDLVESKKV